MDSTYIGAYGHIKALYSDLIKKDDLDSLDSAEGKEFISRLSSTSYKTEIDEFYSTYGDEDIVEIAVNSHFIRTANKALMMLPPIGKDLIKSYLRKIDIQNIKLVLAAKLLGKEMELKDRFLTIDKGFPLGSESPLISNEDYINMINQRTPLDVINYLTNFGYGRVLLRFSASAELSRDVSGMALALDVDYYNELLEKFMFYNGDEGPVLRFIQGIIDVRNIMTLIKAIELKTPVSGLLLDGGSIKKESLTEKANLSIDQLARETPFDIRSANELYQNDGLIANFEVEMMKQLHERYLAAFRSGGASLGSILGFIISAEMEKNSIRLKWFKKYYKLDKELINAGYGI